MFLCFMGLKEKRRKKLVLERLVLEKEKEKEKITSLTELTCETIDTSTLE